MSKEDKSRKRASVDAPKRPPKCVSLQSRNDEIMDKPIFSEKQKKEDESFGIDDDEEYSECMICKKVLSHLIMERRVLHINACLDREETLKKQEKAAEKHQNTIDCPICHTPFPQGPHRTAHLKMCAKRNNISGEALLKMEEVQQKVVKANKAKGLTHTRAPQVKVKAVVPKKLSGQPRTVNQEQIQIATALSNSLKKSPPKTIQDFKETTPEYRRIEANENRRKRPRSFAVVEFAPRSCQCQVISTIQSRFVDAFKSAVNTTKIENNVSLLNSSQAKYQRRLVEKANRYEEVTNDFGSLLDRGEGADMHITCNDGVIPTHKTILMARTIGFLERGKDKYQISESKEIILNWLKFIYTGRVEWSADQEEGVHELGKKYGPSSILFTRVHREKFVYEEVDHAPISSVTLPSTSISKADSDVIRITPKSTDKVASVLNLSQKLDRFEDTICGILNATEPNDGENPLQGVFNKSVVEQQNISNKTGNNQRLSERSNSVEIVDVISNMSEVNESFGEKSEGKMLTDKGSKSSCSDDIFEEDESIEPWHMTGIVLSMSTDEASKSQIEINGKTIETIKEGKDDANEPRVAEIKVETEPEQTGFHEISGYPYMDEYEHFDNNFEDYYEPMPYSLEKATCSSVKASNDNLHANSQTETPKTHKRSSLKDSFDTTLAPKSAKSQDSFDETVVFVPLSSSTPKNPLADVTPQKPGVKKVQFTSNIKILKTVGITPMPNYNQMSDDQLKNELARFGLRPMAKKRAIKKLEEIYNFVHPEIDSSTPTIRPLNRNVPGVKEVDETESPTRKKTRLPESRPTFNSEKLSTIMSISESDSADSEEKSEGNGNRTLNSEGDEPAEETLLDDPTTLPKNLKEMISTFLRWVRKSENEQLYTHMLGLQPVLLDELHLKVVRANDPVCGIPKNSLATILETLGITFSLPATTRGRGKPTGRGKFRHKK